MKHTLIYTFLVLSTIYLVSCDRPKCNNENPIFENYEPNSEKYKDELARQLGTIDQKELTYWLQKYEKENKNESLYFHIQGEGLCAILHLSMNHWDKMENIREKKGVGRRGAEFTNLKFDIVQDSLSTKFIYSTFDRIID